MLTFSSQADVAELARILLHRDNYNSPFAQTSLADVRGVADFRLEIEATSASEWNKSATKVFVNRFLECNYNCRDRKLVEKMFKAHYTTLQSHFKAYGIVSPQRPEVPQPGDDGAGPSNENEGGDETRSSSQPTPEALAHSSDTRRGGVRLFHYYPQDLSLTSV